MLTNEEKISQSSYGTVSGRSHPNFAGVIQGSMEKFVTLVSPNIQSDTLLTIFHKMKVQISSNSTSETRRLFLLSIWKSCTFDITLVELHKLLDLVFKNSFFIFTLDEKLYRRIIHGLQSQSRSWSDRSVQNGEEQHLCRYIWYTLP